MQSRLELGAWNTICDRCGLQFKNYSLKKTWDGLMVCECCWEPRHPQEILKPVREKISPPWVRTKNDTQFINPQCTITGRSAIAGQAVAGCSICGLDTGSVPQWET